VKFLVLVSVYAIDWTWFENEGQVSKGRKKLTITLLKNVFAENGFGDYIFFVKVGGVSFNVVKFKHANESPRQFDDVTSI
jgi:hypothetical protein